jgi:SAM-dependent methyltransferase
LQTRTLQEDYYDENVDYMRGSPHLADSRLRERLVAITRAAVSDLRERGLPLRVLEVGAGHGGYTEPLLALGCEVTAVEMSKPSAHLLTTRFQTNDRMRVIHDSEGQLSGVGTEYSLVVCVSVLHHIPDYMRFLELATARLVPGGGFLCLQDPLWYERIPRSHKLFNRAAYLSWRLSQGDLVAGLATSVRRFRGTYDEMNPGDMVEYHVVRSGVDERAITDMLQREFEHVELVTYWSNQSQIASRFGERRGWMNTFGAHATGWRPLVSR